MRAHILLPALCVLFYGVAALAQDQAPVAGQGLTLTAAIERALAANHSIAAARLLRPVGAAGVLVAAERPNPELAYEISKDTPHQSIGATIPIELGGKRQARIALASAGVAVTEAELARIISDVRNDVRRAYFEVVAADVRVQIAADLRTLSQRARDAANARVTAGDVPQSDLTQADLALAASDSDLIAARGEASATRAELNALLGQPAGTSLVLADSLTDMPLPSTDDAIARATQVNTELQVLDRRIAEQTARLNLARTQTTPDVAAGAALTYDAEPEFKAGWRVSAGVTLPVLATHRAGVAVERAALTQLQAERASILARIGGAIAAAIVRAASAREQAGRYQSIILPLSIQAEQQAQVAYAGGQIGSPALVQALQIARETRRRGLDAALEYQRALADLERAIGAPLR